MSINDIPQEDLIAAFENGDMSLLKAKYVETDSTNRRPGLQRFIGCTGVVGVRIAGRREDDPSLIVVNEFEEVAPLPLAA